MPIIPVSQAKNLDARFVYTLGLGPKSNVPDVAEALLNLICEINEHGNEETTMLMIVGDDRCQFSLMTILGILYDRGIMLPTGVTVTLVHFRLYHCLGACINIFQNVRQLIAYDCELAAPRRPRSEKFVAWLHPFVEFCPIVCREYTGCHPKDPSVPVSNKGAA